MKETVTLNIALVAQDAKKKLIQNFCIAYKHILNRHHLLSTGTTGALLEEVTNLAIKKQLAGELGGVQQILANVDNNLIDVVIFLTDPNKTLEDNRILSMFIKACEKHNVPLATNIATAEILIKSLDRGDLNWREMYR